MKTVIVIALVLVLASLAGAITITVFMGGDYRRHGAAGQVGGAL